MLLDESCGVCVALKYKSERLCYAGDDETTIFFLCLLRLLVYDSIAEIRASGR